MNWSSSTPGCRFVQAALELVAEQRAQLLAVAEPFDVAQRGAHARRRQVDRHAVGDARARRASGRRCAEPPRSRRAAATAHARSRRCRCTRRPGPSIASRSFVGNCFGADRTCASLRPDSGPRPSRRRRGRARRPARCDRRSPSSRRANSPVQPGIQAVAHGVHVLGEQALERAVGRCGEQPQRLGDRASGAASGGFSQDPALGDARVRQQVVAGGLAGGVTPIFAVSTCDQIARHQRRTAPTLAMNGASGVVGEDVRPRTGREPQAGVDQLGEHGDWRSIVEKRGRRRRPACRRRR